MPSTNSPSEIPRRRVLTGVGIGALAGCLDTVSVPGDGDQTGVNGTDDGSETDGGDTPTETPEPRDRFVVDHAAASDVDPTEEPIAVVSDVWRDWLHRAARGETIREAVENPAVTFGPPDLRGIDSVELQGGDVDAGPYEFELTTGPDFDRHFTAVEDEEIREDDPHIVLQNQSTTVQADLETFFEGEVLTIPPYRETNQVLSDAMSDGRLVVVDEKTHEESGDEGTDTILIGEITPTYTPIPDFYVVLELTELDTAEDPDDNTASDNDTAPFELRVDPPPEPVRTAIDDAYTDRNVESYVSEPFDDAVHEFFLDVEFVLDRGELFRITITEV